VTRLKDWDYTLPQASIAVRPARTRDASRLLVVDKHGEAEESLTFASFPTLLRAGDTVVVNDTKVMASRLFAHRETGGKVEVFILSPAVDGDDRSAMVLLKPGKRIKVDEALTMEDGSKVRLLARVSGGRYQVRFDRPTSEVMVALGAMPLPPYLGRAADIEDTTRYQTVYADELGAAAAPTAGLHMTPEIIQALQERGVGFAKVTLHVGIGTFRPVQEEDIARGRLHTEEYRVPQNCVDAIKKTRRVGGRVIAIGTTSLRALEAATPFGECVPEAGRATTDIFIRPPYEMRTVNGLVTNFHLPRSSLLMLVGAMLNRERTLRVYQDAVNLGYRFYSYGDAMFII
jgi:S-adenosylmethionine:tRNA ribosyltransferase-isomerase